LAIPQLIAACLVTGIAGAAGQTWQDALRKMPLPESALPISRENCVSVCLTNFQSNTTVKALIFLPAVSDDFYLVNRDKPKLNITAGNLFEALSRLTNSTECQLTFTEPFLLVHLARDLRQPSIVIKDDTAAASLRRRKSLPTLICADKHWDSLQPILQKSLGFMIRPLPGSEDAWHFDRHNFAAHGLTDWEILSAVSLTAHTTAFAEKNRIIFEPNRSRSQP
jgi:hypothetical protein